MPKPARRRAQAGVEHVVEGRCTGRMAPEPRGANGFGYDPVFFSFAHGCGAAELPAAVKNRDSHRGVALAKLRRLILPL